MKKDTRDIPIHISRWSSDKEEDRFIVENPATGEPINVVQGGGESQIGDAVNAAQEAFHQNWRWVPAQERGRLLRQCANVIKEHMEETKLLKEISHESLQEIKLLREELRRH